MRLVQAAESLVSVAKRLAPHEIEVGWKDPDDFPGLALPYGAEWIICGQYGASMHDDAHTPRYSVLLVVIGSPGWRVAHMPGPARRVEHAPQAPAPYSCSTSTVRTHCPTRKAAIAAAGSRLHGTVRRAVRRSGCATGWKGRG